MAPPDERQDPVTDEFDDDIHEVPSHTPDFRTELAEELARLVPEAVADGKIDLEKLRELLDEDAAHEGRERFGLMWPGKSRALKAAQVPTTATLVPDREISKDWDTTQNVFIEGDNLEVLKILQKHYHGKIKLIYIDPPYNTGNDFIYPDNYKEGLQTYLEWTKQVSEEGKKLSSNPESDGRFHSNWLNMMYPRLKLARNLLADDGLIAISIDDNELRNLQGLCAEVFGEANQLGVTVVKRPSETATAWKVHKVEFLLTYAKNIQNLTLDGGVRMTQSRGTVGNVGQTMPWIKFPAGLRVAGVPDGIYQSPRQLADSKENIESEGPIVVRDGRLVEEVTLKARWRASRDMTRFFENNCMPTPAKIEGEILEIWLEGDRFMPQIRKQSPEKLSTLILENPRGSRDLQLLGLDSLIDYPKSVGLLRQIVGLVNKDALILDFFSGSATTAHAVMAANAEDGGNRHHIQVQLPEPVNPESEAGKAGFGTIADISRERIQRAGQKISDEFGDQLSTRKTPLDVGFRSYKLADTSFVKWRETSGTGQSALEERLAGLRGSADDNASPEMLLTEILLKQGYSLTENVSEIEIAGLKVWSVADGAMLAITDEHVKPSLEQLRAVVEAGPVRLVILEDVFAGDDQLKTNLVQLAKTHGVELWSA